MEEREASGAGRPLTRRELRALRAAGENGAEDQGAPDHGSEDAGVPDAHAHDLTPRTGRRRADEPAAPEPAAPQPGDPELTAELPRVASEPRPAPEAPPAATPEQQPVPEQQPTPEPQPAPADAEPPNDPWAAAVGWSLHQQVPRTLPPEPDVDDVRWEPVAPASPDAEPTAPRRASVMGRGTPGVAGRPGPSPARTAFGPGASSGAQTAQGASPWVPSSGAGATPALPPREAVPAGTSQPGPTSSAPTDEPAPAVPVWPAVADPAAPGVPERRSTSTPRDTASTPRGAASAPRGAAPDAAGPPAAAQGFPGAVDGSGPPLPGRVAQTWPGPAVGASTTALPWGPAAGASVAPAGGAGPSAGAAAGADHDAQLASSGVDGFDVDHDLGVPSEVETPFGQVPGARPGELPTLTDLLAARPAPASGPAEMGWQGTVRRLTGGLVAPAPGRPEQLHRTAVATVQRGLDGPKTIVVINPKGGAHKTTATLLLAATFGLHRGGSTLAWDNNETRGTLGWRSRAAAHHNTAVNLLQDLDKFADPGSARVGDLDSYVRSQGAAQFDVLASDEDAASAASIDAFAFRSLHRTLARFYRVMVVDTGNNMRASNWQAAIEAADQVVIVSTVREDTAQSAAWAVDALRATGHEDVVRNAVTVLSAPAPRVDERLAERLHAHFGRLTREVVDVPYEPSLVSGRPLDFDALTPPTREAWLRVTAAVAEGL
ncbi:MinD/ParA family ATP-binding protein [Actinotalea subterranea]|uniref:MinD/ParA family ATP-binding protein n=1 Tax=Actinotalea subterranea TaxID=2607497 RepID=UPI0011EF1EBF|nr:chromosome partitioning protein [Actinotalea subterranea]